MAFKMKGHALPGINQRKSSKMKDGRASSAAFQQKKPESPDLDPEKQKQLDKYIFKQREARDKSNRQKKDRQRVPFEDITYPKPKTEGPGYGDPTGEHGKKVDKYHEKKDKEARDLAPKVRKTRLGSLMDSTLHDVWHEGVSKEASELSKTAPKWRKDQYKKATPGTPGPTPHGDVELKRELALTKDKRKRREIYRKLGRKQDSTTTEKSITLEPKKVTSVKRKK